MRTDLRRLARASRRLIRPVLQPMSGPLRMRGVTLVELLTVMVVLAILSSIAVGSYRRYLVRTNRTDATAMLLRIQVAQEKYFLQNNTYTTDVAGALGFGSTSTPKGYYTVAVAAPAGGTIATSYVATATAAGAQASDDASCQTLSISDQGQRGSSPGATSVCWH